MPVLFLAAALAAAAPPQRTVNGTTTAQRAAAPDLRFAAPADAKLNCEKGTIRPAPGGGYSCSSARRPIVRSTTRRRTE